MSSGTATNLAAPGILLFSFFFCAYLLRLNSNWPQILWGCSLICEGISTKFYEFWSSLIGSNGPRKCMADHLLGLHWFTGIGSLLSDHIFLISNIDWLRYLWGLSLPSFMNFGVQQVGKITLKVDGWPNLGLHQSTWIGSFLLGNIFFVWTLIDFKFCGNVSWCVWIISTKFYEYYSFISR